jgi:pimeloyl-ACP methyl ester carboxylesterase
MMQTIHRENADICYSVVGSGDVTLLFVHGSYMDQTYWKSQTDFFKDEYTVVTMDLPGHGQSGKERESWSVEGFAKDVTLLIDKLELKNVILIGHSLAGDINLIVAVALPERLLGFIGIETFKNAATALPEQYRQVSKEILKNLTDDFENTNEYYAKRALLTPQTPPEISQRTSVAASFEI